MYRLYGIWLFEAEVVASAYFLLIAINIDIVTRKKEFFVF